jgi:hypothetical protein
MEVVVVGGTATPKTYRYIAQLEVPMFRHIILTIPESIDLETLRKEAQKLRWQVYSVPKVIAIGSLADRLLKIAGINHGFLPLEKDIYAIKKCKEYLNARS